MRVLHKIRAKLTRKFWVACPHCKKKFGGHEPHAKNVSIGKKRFRYLCPTCSKLALNERA